MSDTELRRQLKEAQQTIKALHQELEETNKGMLALTIELEQRIEQVQASEARFETLVSTIPDIIYRIDHEGKFTFLNSAISSLGYTPEELIGMHFSEIMLPPDAESASREVVLPKYIGRVTGDHDAPKLFDERRTGQRRTTGLEIKLMPKGSKKTIPAMVESLDPDLVAVEISSSGMWETNPKTGAKIFVGTVGVVRDITERKLKDEVIHLTNSELLAINKELESFAYSVSHDLRAPLRSIDGFSLALLEDYADKLDEHGKEYVARVRSAAQRMANLIDDLLTLSRTARIEMEYETVDLSNIANSIVTDLEGTSPERRVQFDISPDLVARGDARLLRLLLENLLRNAWKFTSKHATAKIEFGMIDVDGFSAFFVRDDGAGFDMAYADKLFGAFQRLHSPNEFAGTGIGLATVQRIAHRHGGKVWAEGYVEKGATFYFTLPK